MIKILNFEKYQATGNDFIIINNLDNNVVLERDEVERLCHRRFGIGADGLILLEPSENHDFKMKYYNSDGLEGTFCGNGSRCISLFAYKTGKYNREMTFEASDGVHIAEICDENIVSVVMQDVSEIIEYSDGFFIDTGSPHFVKIVTDLKDVDVYNEGKFLSRQERFYSKTANVNFVEIIDKGLKIATYERGVEDETFSCGTGSIAAAMIYNKFYDNRKFNIDVHAKGGKLNVSFERNLDLFIKVKLKAPAIKVFEAKITI